MWVSGEQSRTHRTLPTFAWGQRQSFGVTYYWLEHWTSELAQDQMPNNTMFHNGYFFAWSNMPSFLMKMLFIFYWILLNVYCIYITYWSLNNIFNDIHNSLKHKSFSTDYFILNASWVWCRHFYMWQMEKLKLTQDHKAGYSWAKTRTWWLISCLVQGISHWKAPPMLTWPRWAPPGREALTWVAG